MTALPPFPNEILDAIIDSAVENLSTRSIKFGLTFTPQLVTLLKQVALTSNYLRQRAQRYLFLEIRLYPFQRHKGGNEGYVPSTLDRFLSTFQNNPQLLGYPRSLVIMGHLQYWGSEFPPHFLSIVLPFFTRNLQKFDHLCIHFNYQRQWTVIPAEFQDAIVHLIKGNRLKSLRLRRLSLPNDFVRILPSTLEAYESGAPAEDDPLFSAQYLKLRHNKDSDRAHNVEPTQIRITWLNEPPGWIESREDSFFQRVTSLDIGVSIVSALTSLMDRIPNTLTCLSLRHRDIVPMLQLQHNNLQGTTFRPMPYLQELKVSIRINECDGVVTCPSQAAMLAGDYICPAYMSIRVFRLVIRWTSSSPADRYLKRTPGGFARLDDLLSDRDVLDSLVEVELDIRPVCSGIDRIADEQARLRGAALEVFHKTVDRFDALCVTTSNAVL